ncbi:Dihydropteroate synthase [Botrimarina colliarenosi]|uniref:Dihydropteroate synthase n=1 Tax=Botrimarina colliarenosi TaxID=2528001 RepID=A0A5C5ZXD7_9BACT|nr:dihydropteroate synthase [Botrimarina colliarenosi]TWT92312.1 Dihydropteroate synthase [Botrimarina colliarenosi]
MSVRNALPAVMGVVNVTPDSFSDGGQFLAAARAVAHGLRLVADGASILDIGGESTRPGAEGVSADEELRRVVPVIEQLAAQTEVTLSIDTSKAVVARAALAAGASLVNDVTGLEGDPEMLAVVAHSDCRVAVMHMRGVPRTMQEDPHYDDVVAEVKTYLASRRDALEVAGVDRERLLLDPGIGFGKTFEHNVTLLRRIGEFHDLGCPLLVGHSRKRFLGEILGDPAADRTAATLGVAMHLAAEGVQVIRVHDVRQTIDALKAFTAVR